MKNLLMMAIAASLTFPIADARAQEGADTLVRTISTDVITAARSDGAIRAGDTARIMALVDSKVMPHVSFDVVTRSAVGPAWREATPQQRHRLQTEFKALLMRVYAGALTQVGEHTVTIVKNVPVAGGTQLIVQTEVRGGAQPIKLDYRLDGGEAHAWKIIDVAVGGLWLVQSYRPQFAQEIKKGGLDGLIGTLAARNLAAVRK